MTVMSNYSSLKGALDKIHKIEKWIESQPCPAYNWEVSETRNADILEAWERQRTDVLICLGYLLSDVYNAVKTPQGS